MVAEPDGDGGGVGAGVGGDLGGAPLVHTEREHEEG